MASIMTVALLAATVCALPSSLAAPTCSAPKARVADFDNLGDTTGLPTTLVPTPYKDLYFQGFRLATRPDTKLPSNGPLPGTLPHSGKTLAISDRLLNTVRGSAKWDTNYANSKVKTFSATSFYYGCNLDTKNSVANVPSPCKIKTTGFAASNNDPNVMVQVASQEFSYEPESAASPQALVLGEFNDKFVNLKYITLDYSLEGIEASFNGGIAMAIDDVIYSICT